MQHIPFEVKQEAILHANTVANHSEEAWHQAYNDYLKQWEEKNNTPYQ